MSLAPKQVGLQTGLSDMATGGVITLPNTIDEYRAIAIKQSTAAQVIELPKPVDTSIMYSVDVLNIGAETFTMYGVSLTVGGMARFTWDGGSAWLPDVAPVSVNESVELLNPTALNKVPSLSVAPRMGAPVKFFVNGLYETGGLTADAAGDITVVPANLTYNLMPSDDIVAVYQAQV